MTGALATPVRILARSVVLPPLHPATFLPASGGSIDDLVFRILVVLFVVAAVALLLRRFWSERSGRTPGAADPTAPNAAESADPANDRLPVAPSAAEPFEDESDLRSAGAA